MKKTALILAGGRGERFWPKSRASLPKQFLSLRDDGRTMIQLTVERILPLVSPEDIFISTSIEFLPLVREQLPDVPVQNILCEPVGRNTAPCVGLGAEYVTARYGDAVMLVLPSDSYIRHSELFRSALSDAAELAASGDHLVTLGITPDYPETGYGYIEFDPDAKRGCAFAAERFVEKPDTETAKEYLSSGLFLWNSGIFIWKASAILESIRTFMPETFGHLEKISKAIDTADERRILESEFTAMPSQSIDCGVMERAKNILVIPAAFGWDDVGSWPAVGRISHSDKNGNVVSGNAVLEGTYSSVIQGGKRLIAAVGLTDMIIVDTDDVLLVCPKDSVNEIKKVLSTLSERGTDYL